MQIKPTTGNITFVKIKKIRYLIPTILIIVAFFVSFNILLRRLNFDDQRKYVQFGVNKTTVNFFVETSGLDQSSVLSTLKNQVGISTIIVPEETIGSFESESKLTILSGSQLKNMLRVGQLYRTVLNRLRSKSTINSNSTYIFIDEVNIYERIINYLKLSMPFKSIVEHSGRIIEVKSTIDRVKNVPIGFSEDSIEQYLSYDLNIIPQLQTFEKVSMVKLEYTFTELEKLQGIYAISFVEKFNYGNTSVIQELSKLIKKSDYKLIFPEFEHSNGLFSIGKKMAENVVRTHIISEEEMEGMTFDTVFNRYLRALKERSLQLLILSPRTTFNEDNLYDQNIFFFRRVIETFIRSGGEIINYFPELFSIAPSIFELFLISLGIFSMLFLLLVRVHLLNERKHILWLLTILGVILLLLFISFPNLVVPILGVVSVVVGSLMGIVYFFPEDPVIYRSYLHKCVSLIRYLGAVLIVSMVSILFCISLYSDPVYLQNVSSYRGVKIVLLIPVVLIAMYYFCGPKRVNSIYYILRRVIRWPLTVGSLTVCFFIMLLISFYLMRSGNYFSISIFETEFRLLLENMFYVRPRFKEVLIGYPALLLGYWFVDYKISRNFIWVFNSIGIIAITSMINSFCHFHTPILISFYRSIIGLICGVIVAVCLYYVYRVSNLLVKSLSKITEK